MGRNPLSLPTLHEKQRFARNREQMHETIWAAMPEILEGAIALARGIRTTVDGQTVYEQAPDMEAIRFLTERVDGRAAQPHTIDGSMNVNHNYDALLDRLITERAADASHLPALRSPQVIEGEVVELSDDQQTTLPPRAPVVESRDRLLRDVLGLSDDQTDGHEADSGDFGDQTGHETGHEAVRSGMTSLFDDVGEQDVVQAVPEEEIDDQGREIGQEEGEIAPAVAEKVVREPAEPPKARVSGFMPLPAVHVAVHVKEQPRISGSRS